MQPSSKMGKERKYIFGPGLMTKMAAVSVYGKNVKKSSSPEPLRPVALKLGMQHLALLNIILALLSYAYKISVSSYPKQISHCSLSAQGSYQDLMVLLF